jgi:glucose/mannose-6-phosphate isomerase
MITHESSLENFTEQFDYVLENYSSHGLDVASFQNIVLGGLGGSGIGAVIAKNWFFDKSPIPVETVADYHLPKYVGAKSLVILNSYSGNTEETLSLFDEATAAGATIVVLTGGGKLGERASELGIKTYSLKGGYQPRMTIGLGLTIISLILGELLGDDQTEVIKEIRAHFNENKGRLRESADQMFDFFKGSPRKKFVIISDRQYAPSAVRFTQQLQENSKLEGFVSVLPEANHNEIESYTHKMDTNFIMLYSNQNERVAARFDFLISHLELENNKILPMYVPEFSLKAIFDVIYRLDWLSVLLANELGSDLMNVPIIMNLKGFLSDLEMIQGEEL